jgi:hypothetical protein
MTTEKLNQYVWLAKEKNLITRKNYLECGAPMARETEIRGSQFETSQGNSSQDPVSKKPNIKRGWWSSTSGRVPA